MAPASSKSTRSPAFQFYPKDFLTSPKVRNMNLLERGAYITLLSVCWLDGSLSADPKLLASELRLPAAQFQRLWAGPLGQCFEERGGRLYNPRLERERKAQSEYRKRQSDNGKHGGRPKAVGSSGLSDSKATAQQVGKPTESSPSSSASAISDLQTAVSQTPAAATLVQRRKKNAAWEGARGLYVLSDQHARFVAFRNHPGADTELFAFYERIAESFQGEIDPNMFRFWDARYSEQWPSASVAKDTRPEWMKKAGVSR